MFVAECTQLPFLLTDTRLFLASLLRLWQRRYFQLQNGVLTFRREIEDGTDKRIFLAGSCVCPANDFGPTYFKLITEDGRRRIFYCDSECERNDWVLTIRRAARFHNIRNIVRHMSFQCPSSYVSIAL